MMQFPQNFSESLNSRIEKGRNADQFVLEFSNINIWMDASSKKIKKKT